MPPPPKPSHRPPAPPHPAGDINEQPISPPLESLPHQKPPKDNKAKTLIIAIIFGSILTVAMGFILKFIGISVNVILPVLAPIWVGTITLIYSVSTKN
ncbi:MAG: hypothetical protein CMI53_04890 [Parcubacteria group bacterium]|nr:hypothetical protein [Parcubacteria group bacterium]|tara:strand:+ start:12897 stop:13190 length:294 start_codon:yes stop_codon:yes gene_type:complete